MRTLAEPARLVPAGGGVLWRTGEDGTLLTALVHRPRYDDWSLPKGKLDPGEHPLVAAVREVGEETGLQVAVGRRSVQTRYAVRAGTKRVDYWLMHVVGGEFTPNDEVDELRWLPLPEAGTLVTHEHDRAVLADLGRDDVPRAPRVLLLRHASAGEREDFDGPDGQRPLDRRGREQSARLAAVLPLFAPACLLSAPPVRCRQTLEPLAAAVALPVGEVPELGEEGFAADPRAGVQTVADLIAGGGAGPAVVCSQGGAIPSVLLALGVHRQDVAGEAAPPAAKGSVWALGGEPGRLAADYYRAFAADPAAGAR